MKIIKKILRWVFEFLYEFMSNSTFYDPNYEIKGLKWRIHKNDMDNWPSIPHLHAIEKNYKMDIYTGVVYNANNKKYIGSIRGKELRKLWQDEKIVDIVIFARQNRGKDMTLPQIPEYAKISRYEEQNNEVIVRID